MKILRLFIPGSFEDAQLYMGHLVVFTTERDVRLVELDSLTAKLEDKYPSWNGILTFAFARNDWLSGGVMTALARNRDLAGVLNDGMDAVARDELILSKADVAFGNLHGFTQSADVVLDTVLYGARMYLGTTAGLFDYDVDWDDRSVISSRQRLDARCVSATAEYGAVNASCEDDGLFTGYDEFGWRGKRDDFSAMAQTASRSMRSAWYGTDLVNYETPIAPELLRSSVDSVNVEGAARDRNRKVVTMLGAPTDELDAFLAGLEADRGVPKDDVQFVWNSSRAFFINTHSHGFFSAWETSSTNSGVGFTKHRATVGRVIAVHTSAAGWIIETDFRAYVMSRGQLFELAGEEPLAVRTFAGSKRYRRMVAITTERGVHLVSIVDPV